MPRISSEGFAGDAARDSRGWGDEAITGHISGKGGAEGARGTIATPITGMQSRSKLLRFLGNSEETASLSSSIVPEFIDTDLGDPLFAPAVHAFAEAMGFDRRRKDQTLRHHADHDIVRLLVGADVHDRASIAASRAAS